MNNLKDIASGTSVLVKFGPSSIPITVCRNPEGEVFCVFKYTCKKPVYEFDVHPAVWTKSECWASADYAFCMFSEDLQKSIKCKLINQIVTASSHPYIVDSYENVFALSCNQVTKKKGWWSDLSDDAYLEGVEKAIQSLTSPCWLRDSNNEGEFALVLPDGQIGTDIVTNYHDMLFAFCLK